MPHKQNACNLQAAAAGHAAYLPASPQIVRHACIHHRRWNSSLMCHSVHSQASHLLKYDSTLGTFDAQVSSCFARLLCGLSCGLFAS